MWLFNLIPKKRFPDGPSKDQLRQILEAELKSIRAHLDTLYRTPPDSLDPAAKCVASKMYWELEKTVERYLAELAA